MKKILIAIVVVVLLIGVYFWSTYNKLVKSNEGVNGQWAQVESQYQRRFDFIPNLVALVEANMKNEQKIFKDLADARSRYAGSANPNGKAAAATEVEGALSRLLVVMENYPDLKSSTTVQGAIAELAGTENRIATERGRYNEVARDFNAMIKMVPAKWVASMFGFEVRNYFESEAGAEKAPKIDIKFE